MSEGGRKGKWDGKGRGRREGIGRREKGEGERGKEGANE